MYRIVFTVPTRAGTFTINLPNAAACRAICEIFSDNPNVRTATVYETDQYDDCARVVWQQLKTNSKGLPNGNPVA